MSEEIKHGDNTDLESTVNELNSISLLFKEFGPVAFRAMEKYYQNMGYETGVEKFLDLIKTSIFSRQALLENPVKNLERFILEYFDSRGGNKPEIWTENDTVFLKTARSVFCPVPVAEEHVGVPYRDICHIHRRSFMKGYVKVFEEFLPGTMINCYNFSSRKNDKVSDCVEAFQVITP